MILLTTEANKKKAAKIISKFLQLEPEMRGRILNAAINEFAKKGFKKVSANEIVREAGFDRL